LQKLFLVFASVLVAVLIAEIGHRLWHGVPIFNTPNYVLVPTDVFQSASGCRYDPLLGWRLRDYIAGKDSAGSMTSGEFGVRMNSDRIESVPRGGILAVGDSFAVGSCAADSESWPAHLEKLVKTPTVNAAAGGWGVDQMVLRAESLAPVLRPKALIVGILDQDVLRNTYDVYGIGGKPYFEIVNGKAELRGTPVPIVQPQYREDTVRSIFGRFFLVHKLMLRWFRDEWLQERKPRYRQIHKNEKGVEIACHLMDRLVRLRDDYALRVLVLMQYEGLSYSRDGPDYLGPSVLACAKRRGLEVVDSWPTIKKIADSDPKRFKKLWCLERGVLGHMSSKGNHVIATLLRDALSEPHAGRNWYPRTSLPFMSGASMGSAKASASSELDGFEAFRAFGGAGRGWFSGPGRVKDQWIEILPGPKQRFAAARWRWRCSSVPIRQPKRFKLQGFDGSAWHDLHTEYYGTDHKFVANTGDWTEWMSFSNSAEYAGYRVFVVSNYGAHDHIGILEVQIAETHKAPQVGSTPRQTDFAGQRQP